MGFSDVTDKNLDEVKGMSKNADLQIVPYEKCFQPVFKALNELWITAYWQLDAHDLDVLDYPQENILDKGGFIYVAIYRNTPVGVCALCKMDDNSLYDYELAKLAVSPQYRGKGTGRLLCEAVIEKAKSLGAANVFLESNTILKPAVELYRKLGFRELKEYIPVMHTRGNIQMELPIE